MTNNLVYFKDILNKEDNLILQLQCAKEYYERIDRACKNIEQKSQHILTASLTTLGIIFGFLTVMLKDAKNINNENIIIISIFIILITFTISLACYFALKTFDLSVYYIVGHDDTLELNEDAKKQLIAKYINYAEVNACTKREKRDNLIKSYSCFKFILLLITFYSVLGMVIFTFPQIVLHIKEILNLTNVLIILIILGVCVRFFICIKNKYQDYKNNLKHYKLKENMQKQAYFNHIDYPQNSDLENWLWAKEKVLLEDKMDEKQ